MVKRLIYFLLIVLSFSAHAHDFQAAQLEYVENAGQWENQVRYKVDLKGGWAFMENDGITFLFSEKQGAHRHKKKESLARTQNSTEQNKVIKFHAYKMNWVNARPTVATSEKVLPNYHNYFVGNDQTKWKSNVKIWRNIVYPNIYDNIDVKVYSMGTSMKSDYIVKVGGRPSDIQVKYEGVDGIRVMDDGRLHIKTSVNEIFEYEPYAYQEIDGKQVEVLCKYSLKNGILKFDLPNSYNKNYPLVIDPTLVFSTYTGGTSETYASSSTNDRAGNMFLGGIAFSGGYPTTQGAFQTTFRGPNGGTDVVITKLTANGASRIYSTYIGGGDSENVSSLLCTDQNELIALMTTESTNFPTSSSGYRRTNAGNNDLVIVKFNAAGTSLVGGTYFGGSQDDGNNSADVLEYNYGDYSRGDIAIDQQGNIYVSSVTFSSNLPGTSGTFQPSNRGGCDGLVAKFNANLSSLIWASYLGGSSNDAAYALRIDKENNIFVCGGTRSNNLSGTANGLNPSSRGGNADGFVAKINNAGTTIINATYLGTDRYDQAYLLDLDPAGNPVILGQTLGAYPVSQGTYRNTNAKQFIHKLNNNLTQTIYSTVFGTANSNNINISPTSLLVDDCGNLYAVGWGGGLNASSADNLGTTSGMPVTQDAIRTNTDGEDFYLISLNDNATQLLYGSYFGALNDYYGDHVDGGTSRFDKSGVIYQAVCSSCDGDSDFPTTQGVVAPTNTTGACSMVGFKYQFDLRAMKITGIQANPAQGCGSLTTSFNFTSTRAATSYSWNFGDGGTSTQQFPSHTYNQPGNYTVKLIIRNPNECNLADSITINVNVYNKDSINLNRAICEGQSVSIGQQTFTQPGNYSVKLTNTFGCDSTINLNLSFTDSIVTNLRETICFGTTFSLANQTLDSSGVYRAVVKTAEGCDSIINLNLRVLPKSEREIVRSICTGQSFSVGDQSFNETGFYVVVLKSSANCDSTVSLDLSVGDKAIINFNERLCKGQSFVYGNQSYSEAGDYQIEIASETCDTLINISIRVDSLPDLTLSAEPTSVEPGETVSLTAASESEFDIIWSPAQVVEDVQNPNTTASINQDTWFTALITDFNGCSVTDSILVTVEIVDCSDGQIFIPSAFTPNGDKKNDVFLVRTNADLEEFELSVYNRWGEKIFNSSDQNMGWDGNFKGKMATAGSYGYYFRAKCGESIIEKKGNVTIIR